MSSSRDYVDNIEKYIIKQLPPPFDRYYATACGRIISDQRGRLKFINGKLDKDGYVSLILRHNGKNSYRRLHRLVLLAFVGEPEENLVVRHKDGNRLNNCLDNLAYSTQKENISDKKKHGTYLCGEDTPNATITNTEATAIVNLLLKNMLVKDIVDILKVSKNVVYRIKYGGSWVFIAKELGYVYKTR